MSMVRFGSSAVLLAVRAGASIRACSSRRAACASGWTPAWTSWCLRRRRVAAEVADLVKALQKEGVMYTLAQKSVLRRRDIVDYANTTNASRP